MTKTEKTRRRIGTHMTVSFNRLERTMSRLSDDDVLSLYEEGSNMLFHMGALEAKATGAVLLNAAVHVLSDRYKAIGELDLTKPFPLRQWMAGVPQESGA